MVSLAFGQTAGRVRICIPCTVLLINFFLVTNISFYVCKLWILTAISSKGCLKSQMKENEKKDLVQGLAPLRGLPWWLRWERIFLPIQKTWVQSLGREDPLEEGMASHFGILTLRIPGTEEPDGL